MELRELIGFYHVAQLRSFSKAARLLRTGQPTLSHQLKKLEKEFGVVLLDRVKRPIQLTSEGSTIFELITPIIHGIGTLKTYVDSPEDQGSFTIGAYPDLALHHLPPIIQSFQARYPAVRIRLLARSYSTLVQLVASAEADLAVCTRPLVDNPLLEFEELFQYRIVLLTPPGHQLVGSRPIRLEDIARWPLILFGPDASTRIQVEQALNDRDISYNIALEVDSAELAKRYVEIGMGVALCSDFALQPDDYKRLGVLQLDHLFSRSAIGILRLKGRFLGRSLSNYVQLLKEELSDTYITHQHQDATGPTEGENGPESSLTSLPQAEKQS